MIFQLSEEILKIAREVTAREKPEEALTIILRRYIQGRIAECEEEIKKFESKYGMSIKDFYEKLGRDFPLTWEHERDYMDWDWAIAEIEELKERLKKLEKYGS